MDTSHSSSSMLSKQQKKSKRKLLFGTGAFAIVMLVLLMSMVAVPAFASENSQKNLTLYFFWGNGCPHCAKEEPFLEEMQAKYPSITIKKYETWFNKSNAEYFKELSDSCNSKITGVPTLFIGDDIIVGFNEEITPKKIESKIVQCLEKGCPDPTEKLSCNNPEHEHVQAIHNNTIELPIIGKINSSKISLPLFTFIIALLDGFNPCAMWVLCFLLTLLIYAKSRKKIILIGSVFLASSAAIYFLFMTAWLNFFLLVGYVNLMRIAIACIAIGAGLINMKDFFWFKKGVSLTIPDKYKPKLFSKMRSLVKEQKTAGIIIGTIILASFANLIELLCTAGFPAIYTRVLTMQNFSSVGYYSYLVLYNIIYVIPLAAIVAAFAYTMGAHRFTEKHGKILKLLGGLLMLTLGIILMFRPELLSFG